MEYLWELSCSSYLSITHLSSAFCSQHILCLFLFLKALLVASTWKVESRISTFNSRTSNTKFPQFSYPKPTLISNILNKSWCMMITMSNRVFILIHPGLFPTWIHMPRLRESLILHGNLQSILKISPTFRDPGGARGSAIQFGGISIVVPK